MKGYVKVYFPEDRANTRKLVQFLKAWLCKEWDVKLTWILNAGYGTSHPVGLRQAVGLCLHAHMEMFVLRHKLM